MPNRSRYRRPSLRGALVAAAVVAVISVLVGVGVALRGEDSGDADERDVEEREEVLEREGSEEVAGGDVLEITDEPESYRITYRVTERGGGPQTEELVVVRPFWSEVVTRGPSGDIVNRQRWAFGRVHTVDGPIFAVGPTVPATDLRIAPVLEDALAADLLDRREQREVAGRRCQVYRAWASVVAGTLPAEREEDPEYADVCVDERGLIIEEWWVVKGDALRQRVAIDVVEDAPLALIEAWANHDPTMEIDRGGGSVLRVRDDSAPPGPFFTVPAPPDGFRHVGRFSVIPPQADAFDEDTGRGGSLLASTADVWQRGVDIVVLDQGGTLGGLEVYTPDPDNRLVELPGLGSAEIVVSLNATEIRVQRPGGKFVRVLGTLAPDDLLDVARSLVEGTGSELVVLDDAALPQP